MTINYRESSYHEKRHGDLLKSEELRQAWSHFARLAYFPDISRDKKVLEFGAGLGSNLLALPSLSSVWAYEPSQLGVEMSIKDGLNATCDLNTIKGRKFDRVLCRHVLEHVDHPKQVLEEIMNFLVPGGTLTLVLPLDPLTQKPKENDINNHIYCWNPRTIHNLLKHCGYADINWRYEYYGARRKLLPVYRKFGGKKYAWAVRHVGRVFNFREMLITTKKDKSATS